MRELSLHILDIAQNSISAGAKYITIEINENEKGFFVFRVIDDGCGMTEEMLSKVRDPFTTTRKTRKVGMGIPFLDMVTQQCGGYLNITSNVGQGTSIEAYFKADNIDRPPLGNLIDSLRVLLVGILNDVDIEFIYTNGSKSMIFKTKDVRKCLGKDCDFSNPIISAWIEQYLRENLNDVQSEENK